MGSSGAHRKSVSIRELIVSVGDPRNPVLNRYMASNARVSIIRGPLGSGKTVGTITGPLLRHMIEQEPNSDGVRPTKGLAIRNTYADLMQTTLADFQHVFGDIAKVKRGGLEPPTAHVAFGLPDGTRVESEVVFLALDREDSVRKLRGYNISFVWMNETKELQKAVFDMADLRHGRYPSIASQGVNCTWHGIMGDSNSWDEDHWLWPLATNPPEDWKFFHQPGGLERDGLQNDGSVKWKANPNAENFANLPERYYERGMAGKDESWIAVNLGNEYGFTIDGEPVWREFIDSKHVPEEPIAYDRELPLLLGVDFGRTPACAILQYQPAVGRYSVIDEFVSEGMSASVFAPELRLYLGREYPQATFRGWGDPAGDRAGQTVETTPIQVMNAAGIPIQPAPTNEMLLRRSAVIAPLKRLAMDGRPALMISSKAKILRKGAAGGFCYRKLNVSGDARYGETPDKNFYSHVCESLEYALLGEGEGVATLHYANPGGGSRQFEADM